MHVDVVVADAVVAAADDAPAQQQQQKQHDGQYAWAWEAHGAGGVWLYVAGCCSGEMSRPRGRGVVSRDANLGDIVRVCSKGASRKFALSPPKQPLASPVDDIAIYVPRQHRLSTPSRRCQRYSAVGKKQRSTPPKGNIHVHV
ncbi:hypothetical protein CDD83_5770 [Cordyceps sp. RAO-2017]|nr:hypothetical protein CDD83_5770 [Cordyceps sp. RAO-2017]